MTQPSVNLPRARRRTPAHSSTPAESMSTEATPRPEEQPEPTIPLRTLRSEDLLQGQPEVLIAHGNDIYRLRLTRNGKLILQK